MKIKYLAVIAFSASICMLACKKETKVSPDLKIERRMDAVADTSTTDTGGEDKPKPIH